MSAMNPPIAFTLDSRAVAAQPGETLIEVARREGVDIPHLCWTPGLAPAGNWALTIRSFIARTVSSTGVCGSGRWQ